MDNPHVEGRQLGICTRRFNTLVQGFTINITGPNLVGLLADNKDVIATLEVPKTASIAATQSRPPWGVDRSDQNPGGATLDNTYTYNYPMDGTGVHVYIIDTGVRASHQDFLTMDGSRSRVLTGFNAVGDGQGTGDCNGHGTHCAGIVAGRVSGLAKNAYIHSVRAMGCDGNGGYGNIIAGLDWIAANKQMPAVVSMSITTPTSVSLDQAVNNLVATSGITVVAAAGNFAQNTCNYSPARATSVIAVGATNRADSISWFSNYGSCTTLFAPGEDIDSASYASDTGIVTLSGTSMATPFVAGAAALYLSANIYARPSEVRQALLDGTLPNTVRNTIPGTGTPTSLMNTRLSSPLVDVSPRSWVTSENSKKAITVRLKARPANPVYLQPAMTVGGIGRFVPSRLTFDSSNWQTPQAVALAVPRLADYLDHTSLIQFNFISRDARFMRTLEGYLDSQDTDVCRSCGDTFANPKVVPKLPFYHEWTTTGYQDNYNDGGCTGSGPDVVYAFTPPWSMSVSVDLCSSTTQFDTMMAIYQKTGSGSASLIPGWCNDDYCNVQSAMYNLPMTGGQTYYIVVDGYNGANGPYGINIVTSTPPPSGQAWPRSVGEIVNATEVPANVPAPVQTVSKGVITRWNYWVAKQQNGTSGTGKGPGTGGLFSVYSWVTTDWSACSASCGGGMQTRTAFCEDTIGNVVDVSNCDADTPLTSQACNQVACPEYSWFAAGWSECPVTCGGGTQTQAVYCKDANGNLVEASACAGQPAPATSQPCATSACGQYYWAVPGWSQCNRPCGGGTVTRDLQCVETATGNLTDVANCGGAYDESAPPTSKPCNLQPCQAITWLASPWGDCPVTANCSSVQTRVVECVDQQGLTRDGSFCDAAGLIKPGETQGCRSTASNCDYCKNCSGHGTCINRSFCQCAPGWKGDLCETPTTCPGIPSGAEGGTCCLSGVVGARAQCCAAAAAVVDAAGECCESGHVDACGVCDGASTSVDALGRCCATVRDEKGVCCASGQLDECSICDGDGTSCVSMVGVTLDVSGGAAPYADNSSAYYAPFQLDFRKRLAAAVGVALEGVAVRSMAVDNSNGDLLAIESTVSAVGLTAGAVITHAAATQAALTLSVGQNSDGQDLWLSGAALTAVTHVQKAGVCGNGMCELGERCTAQGTSATMGNDTDPVTGLPVACCYQDCQFVPMLCPAPALGARAGQPCAGAGRCLDSTGVCDCFTGHAGADCSQCADGWSLTQTGLCVFRLDGSLLAQPSSPTVGSPPSRGNTTNATILDVPTGSGSGNGNGSSGGNVTAPPARHYNAARHWGIGLGVSLAMGIGFPGMVIGALLVYVHCFKKRSAGTPRAMVRPVSEAEEAATVATPEEAAAAAAEAAKKARGKAKLPEYEEDDRLSTIRKSDNHRPEPEIVEVSSGRQ
ncbi:Subtilisin-related protease with thrombospondin repeats [Klebsormidium nitens]|uniref:Subtilisin-related protease with thrombospondin repeats n=1 Tax=Klebsormidium nitens TaxID=105231 RepID=A0A1Y1IHE2_KLENI|nr:Subtilisin-related protease with thrombospondin repeats [Klebsormidium nitens]|eukprot:GAQ88137.1 Subtilisin-related protease with thrombospondin repeats [Klebsormidium nitens]